MYIFQRTEIKIQLCYKLLAVIDAQIIISLIKKN